MASMAFPPRWPSEHSLNTIGDIGPSPSERALQILPTIRPNIDHTPTTTNDDDVDGDGNRCLHSPSVAADSEILDDDTRSVMTITRTVTRIEDLPDDKSEAIGTVLEEEFPKPVQLMIEFLGTTMANTQATRRFLNQLYDTDIELCLECQFLPRVDLFSNSDPFAELYTRRKPLPPPPQHTATIANTSKQHPWALLGRTETLVDAHFPRFVTKFKLRAIPDQDLDNEILVKVFAKGSIAKSVRLGEASCTLWDVISSNGHCKVLKMDSIDTKKNSWIILSGDIHRGRMHALNPRSIIFHLRFGKSAHVKAKTHYVINRGLPKGRWTPVYRSEGHAHADRNFQPVQLTFAEVFCGDENRPARIEFLQRRSGMDPKLIGFVQLTMRQVEHMDEGKTLPWFCGNSSSPPGALVLSKREVKSSEVVSVWLTVRNT